MPKDKDMMERFFDQIISWAINCIEDQWGDTDGRPESEEYKQGFVDSTQEAVKTLKELESGVAISDFKFTPDEVDDLLLDCGWGETSEEKALIKKTVRETIRQLSKKREQRKK